MSTNKKLGSRKPVVVDSFGEQLTDEQLDDIFQEGSVDNFEWVQLIDHDGKEVQSVVPDTFEGGGITIIYTDGMERQLLSGACQILKDQWDDTHRKPAFDIVQMEGRIHRERSAGVTPAFLGALFGALSGAPAPGGEDMFGNLLASSTPGGIEAMEARGQARLCESCELPLDLNGGRKFATDAKDAYTKMGIEVTGSCSGNDEKIFCKVKLPEGWKLKPTDHSMWSDLVDELGRKRAAIFFKAAFYDYHAHLDVQSRFSVRIESEDAYTNRALTYEDRERLPYFGRVYDGEVVVYATEPVLKIEKKNSRDNAYMDYQDGQEQAMREECIAWLASMGYTDYENPFAYWESTTIEIGVVEANCPDPITSKPHEQLED